MFEASLVGFFTALGLILAIGAQNAFVLHCGLRRQHIFIVCVLCSISDALLICLGVLGLGELVRLAPGLHKATLIAGILFITVYGLLRFKASLRSNVEQSIANEPSTAGKTALLTLAFTWLNPHVYLDTVFLIGAISTQFTIMAELLVFSLGAILASFLFFFSLGYGARLIAPIFNEPARWRYIDLSIGIVMMLIALQLFFSLQELA